MPIPNYAVQQASESYGKAAQMALKVINDSPHGLIHPNGTTDDLNSAYNVIKTTKESAEKMCIRDRYPFSLVSIGGGLFCLFDHFFVVVRVRDIFAT